MQRSMKIRNINKFTKSLAKDVCYSLDIPMKDLKHYMTFKQAKNLVKEFCDDDGYNYSMTRNGFNLCATEMTNWLIGFELAKLSSDGKFECYWDDVSNRVEHIPIGEDDDLA